MIYGDSPEQGFVRGREFDHPKLKLRFTAPPGFRLSNTAEAVVGEHAGGALMRFDGDRPEQPDMSTFSYLTNQWAPGLSMADAEVFSVSGLEAATGSGRIDTQQGAVDVRLIAIRFRPDQVYRFLFVTTPDKTAGFSEPFRRATHSFRALSEAEAAALKPLRLRLVRVGPSDTPEVLARRMAVDDFQLERFLVLNGLRHGARLEPGQIVKIVTE
jgi:predicted Zn-dependent protease